MNNADLKRIALVTGASKGIGRGIALGLARNGWDIVVNYHGDLTGAEETAHEVATLGRRSWCIKADVGYADQADALFAAVAKLEGEFRAHINNAGVQTWSALLDLQEQDFDRTLRTNLKGTFLCTQRAARLMLERGGSIINIGSGANKRPFPKLVDYGASKGGIERLTRVSAVELGPHAIRVNCVAPGAIEIERTQLEAPDYEATWAPITPLRRIGKPIDVAHAVAFLVSDEASFITGQTLYVDGGVFSQGAWPYQ